MENKKELIVKDRHGVEHNLYDLPKNFVFDGDIDLSRSNLKELPDLSTVIVAGDFNCSYNPLKSLKGSPKIVDGDFNCSSCYNISSLEGSPRLIVGNFNCINCKGLTSLEGSTNRVIGDFRCIGCESLVSLEGAPKVVEGFSCDDCKGLTSLKGAPELVGGFFSCCSCTGLTSLEGAPKLVNGNFDCSRCTRLTSLKGAPELVIRDFSCNDCTGLTSLEGAPNKVIGDFYSWYCPGLTSLEGAPKSVGGTFGCYGCDNLKSLLYVPQCKQIVAENILLDSYAPYRTFAHHSLPSSYLYDIIHSEKYKQEIAIEEAMAKTKAKLETKHQDGEKTDPKQVATAINKDTMEDKKELFVKDIHGVEHNLYDLPKNFVFDGDIDLSRSNLKELPDLSTVTVTGDFECSYNPLKSLKGAPKVVGRHFDCRNCPELTSLEGAPKSVGGSFDCYKCTKLTSLKGAPELVGGSFDCSLCVRLTSLKGATEIVGGHFNCRDCTELTSLQGAPKLVGEGFNCTYCDNLKSLLHVPQCKKILADKILSGSYLPYWTPDSRVIPPSDYYDIIDSEKYKQEIAIEETMAKTKAKLATKHQDGEKTDPKDSVTTTVNAAIIKAKESRDI